MTQIMLFNSKDDQNIENTDKERSPDHLPFNQNFIFQLAEIINLRYNNPHEGSYVNDLRKSGLNKIAQKVGEEAVETVIAALNDTEQEFIGETADLIFHLLVLLREKNVSLQMVTDKLLQRHHEYQK
ncbi:phosphoribosyl-ATP pyrophosphatase [Pedobacter westerhofensis]|uniref:Phosphoribosyl-ATP pyrophosphatase n=2 Tax=Pedobacter westerhofensis TaxID=425512 RepID=A0A521FQX4_9SPHI|nr:phosphoribosyl-ATP pyrophosphatase [Pedobacter westerhofensis]